MSAGTLGSCLTVQADPAVVLPARVATFTGRRRIKDLRERPEEGQAGVAVEFSKNNNAGKL